MRTLKKPLSLLLSGVMMLGMGAFNVAAAPSDNYPDKSEISEDYKAAIDVLGTIGVMTGREDGKFDPKATLTRDEGATIMTRLLAMRENVSGRSTFTDVDEWAQPYVAYCQVQGIIAGVGDNKFAPKEPLTGVAFTKMLLCALGYDAEIEQLVGPTWEINTAKLTRSTGLDDDVVDFNPTEAITREQAAQLALNCIKKPMVTYDSKGTSVSVNGADINFGASTWKYNTTASTDTRYDNISEDLDNSSSVQGARIVNFGEEYFDKLVLRGDHDDFMRPSDRWTYDGKKIGNYPKKADATYHAAVENGVIYTDLGLTDDVRSDDVVNGRKRVRIYEDGFEKQYNKAGENNVADNANFALNVLYPLARGGDLEIGGKGVEIEVYSDTVNRTKVYDIIMINTYVGEVTRTYAATSSRDAYIKIDVSTDVTSSWPILSSTRQAPASQELDTDKNFSINDIVTYTWSRIAGDDRTGAIVDAEIADSVEGEVTQVQNDSDDEDKAESVTIDGTRYEGGRKFSGLNPGNSNVNGTYVLYLDKYNYILKIDEIDAGTSNYALILNKQGSTTQSFGDDKVRLLTSDGSVRVVTTNKDYTENTTDNNTYYAVGSIVSYSVNSNGVYTLRRLEPKKCFAWTVNAPGRNLRTTVVTNNRSKIDFSTAVPFVDYSDTSANPTAVSTGATATRYSNVYNNAASLFYAQSSSDYTAYRNAYQAMTVNTNSDTVFSVYRNLYMYSVTENGVYHDRYTGGKVNSYTGTKNAPDVATGTNAANRNSSVQVFYYMKGNTDMARVVFILAGNDAEATTSSKNLFLARESASNLIHDGDTSYFEFNAVDENGRITSVRVDGGMTKDLGGLYSEYETDDDGLIDSFDSSASTITKYGYHGYPLYYESIPAKDNTEYYVVGTGVDKVSGSYTVKLGTEYRLADINNGNYTVDDNRYSTQYLLNSPVTLTVSDGAKIYDVDDDGNIQEINYNEIVIDDNDWVYAIVKEEEVTKLFVCERDDKDTDDIAGIRSYNNSNVSYNNGVGRTSDGLTTVVTNEYVNNTTNYRNYFVPNDSYNLQINANAYLTIPTNGTHYYGDLTVDGTLTVEGTVYAETLTIGSNGHVEVLSGGSLFVDGNAYVNGSNTFVVNEADAAINGTMTIANGSHVEITRGTLTVNKDVILEGNSYVWATGTGCYVFVNGSVTGSNNNRIYSDANALIVATTLQNVSDERVQSYDNTSYLAVSNSSDADYVIVSGATPVAGSENVYTITGDVVIRLVNTSSGTYTVKGSSSSNPTPAALLNMGVNEYKYTYLGRESAVLITIEKNR